MSPEHMVRIAERDRYREPEFNADQVLKRYQGLILAWFLLWSMIAVDFFGFLLIDQDRGLVFSSAEFPRLPLSIAGIQFLLFILAFVSRYISVMRPQWIVLLFSLVPVGAGLMMIATNWFLSLLIIMANFLSLFFYFRRRQLYEDVLEFNEESEWSFSTLFEPSEFWISVLVVVLVIFVRGFELSRSLWALYAVAFILVPLVAISISATVKTRLKTGLKGPLLEWLVLVVLPFSTGEFIYFLVLLAFRQMIRIVRLLYGSQRMHQLVNRLLDVPAQLLAVGFSIIIVLGTIVLSFPSSSATGRSIEAIDALFTATSATCVTGLIVLDTPHDFSFSGQVVILFLIQVGGLGFMTISTFAALLIGKHLGLPHRWALASIIEESDPRSLYRMIRFIILVTVTIEGIGAILLTSYAMKNGAIFHDALWFGVFHAISGFCNAGFALQSDSLESFTHSYTVLMTISWLIIVGGLGFSVLYMLWERIKHPRQRLYWTLHTRLAVLGTVILLLSGSLLFLSVEWDGVLKDLGPIEKVMASFFQSTTTRTAGFNSVSLSELQPATVFLIIVFMFIGACPGSTGGGVKVTTVMILGLSIIAIIRGKRDVEAYGRTIPNDVVFRATALISLSMLFLTVLFFSLLLTQQQSYMDLAFETISAFGTVGLSLGITPTLNSFGKFLIILLMFIGRLGPLTLALMLKVREDRTYRLPYEDVSVG